jgi:molybdate transport system substrate-binding protein
VALIPGALFPALPVAAGEKPDLVVGAASSLHDALEEIWPAFERSQGARLTITYAASGRLAAQIRAGAPIDVFLTARSSMLETMARENLIASRQDFATNTLVVIVPASSSARLDDLAALAATRYARIGIGQPGYVPAGRYAKAALEAAGVYAALEPRLVFGEHVRQVLLYVARGEVDAALVYRTDAARSDRVRVALEVPALANDPITYSAGVSQSSARPLLARAFLKFLVGSDARGVLRRHGFEPLERAALALR